MAVIVRRAAVGDDDRDAARSRFQWRKIEPFGSVRSHVSVAGAVERPQSCQRQICRYQPHGAQDLGVDRVGIQVLHLFHRRVAADSVQVALVLEQQHDLWMLPHDGGESPHQLFDPLVQRHRADVEKQELVQGQPEQLSAFDAFLLRAGIERGGIDAVRDDDDLLRGKAVIDESRLGPVGRGDDLYGIVRIGRVAFASPIEMLGAETLVFRGSEAQYFPAFSSVNPVRVADPVDGVDRLASVEGKVPVKQAKVFALAKFQQLKLVDHRVGMVDAPPSLDENVFSGHLKYHDNVSRSVNALQPDVLARCLLEKAGRNDYENNHKTVGARPAGSGARAAPAS